MVMTSVTPRPAKRLRRSASPDSLALRQRFRFLLLSHTIHHFDIAVGLSSIVSGLLPVRCFSLGHVGSTVFKWVPRIL